MPRKNVKELSDFDEILELSQILNISAKGKDFSVIKQELVELLSKYQSGSLAFDIICDAKHNDKAKRQQLKYFYGRLEQCLESLDEKELSILNGRLGLNTSENHVKDILSQRNEKVLDNDYYILIAGETSSGKSTMINLILGDDLLPSHTLHMTSKIWEIKYGEKSELIIHYKDVNKEDRVIPIEKRRKSFSEQIKPCKNRKEIDLIDKFEVHFPHNLLKEGVVIVDSPGVGHSDEMDVIMTEYLPKAFAYIYVIDISHAGGLEQDLQTKMKGMAEKLNEFNVNDCGHVSRLTECTLFIGNKWDRLKKKTSQEKDEVKQYVHNELKNCWSIANIEEHVIFLSATDIIKVQDYGGIVPEFTILLDSVNKLILRSINMRLYNHCLWMDQVVSEIFRMTRILKQALCNQQYTSNKAKMLREGATKVEETYKEHEEDMKVTLENKKYEFSCKIKEHIQSKDFEDLLVEWESKEAKSLLVGSWEDSQKKIDNAIAEKYSNKLREWERKEYDKIHFEVVKKYSKSFYSLKAYLESFESNDDNKEDKDNDESEDNDESDDDDENNEDDDGNGTKSDDFDDDIFLTTKEKILVGVTSPLWLPVATVGVILVTPVAAGYALYHKISNAWNKHKFSKHAKAYMKEASKLYLQQRKEDDMLERAGQYIALTEKIVFSYEKIIPIKIKALRELAEKLENNARLETRKKYDDISSTSEHLLKEINPLKKELSRKLPCLRA